MGRPPRRSGHLAGTFAPPLIKPNQGNGPDSLSSAQPLHNQPPQVSIPIRQQQQWQKASSQYAAFSPADPYTPSTTDAPSPASSRAALSPGAVSTSTGYTAALGHGRNLSPDVATPSSSVAAGPRYQELYYPEHPSELPAPAAVHPAEYELSTNHEIIGTGVAAPQMNAMLMYPQEDVMGIETRVPFHETAQYLVHSPRFVSTKNSSPTRHQRYPGTTEPWSIYPLRQEDPYAGMDNTPPDMMDYVPDVVQPQTTREKGVGRTGPLSQEQRQHASEVRKNGACLRCSVMREKVLYREVMCPTLKADKFKCDLQSPCTTCSSKDRRKVPRICVPKQFDWEACRRTIFPGKSL
jgi:hypothetical protein